MSEILTEHGRIIERLSRYNNFRFDRVSWPCDGHECPSYIRSFRRRTQNLTHLQHVLTCGHCNLHIRACGRVAELGSPLCPIPVSRSACSHARSGAHAEHSRGPRHQSATSAALPQKESWRIRRGSPQIAARSPDSVQHLQSRLVSR